MGESTSRKSGTALEETAVRIGAPCGQEEMLWRLWGAGRPLVLPHGAFASWNRRLPNVPGLSRHFRVLVPDMPGDGDSTMPPPLSHRPRGRPLGSL